MSRGDCHVQPPTDWDYYPTCLAKLGQVRAAGSAVVGRQRIFPTVPVPTHLIRRHPRSLIPLHRWLTRLLPVPGRCLLNLITLRKGASA